LLRIGSQSLEFRAELGSALITQQLWPFHHLHFTISPAGLASARLIALYAKAYCIIVALDARLCYGHPRLNFLPVACNWTP
jgi:hypothetical protein